MTRISRYLALIGLIGVVLVQPVFTADTPKFQVDPSWPKTLPNQWILGQIGGIRVDDGGRSDRSNRSARSDRSRNASNEERSERPRTTRTTRTTRTIRTMIVQSDLRYSISARF
jgi:hypothetical protein